MLIHIHKSISRGQLVLLWRFLTIKLFSSDITSLEFGPKPTFLACAAFVKIMATPIFGHTHLQNFPESLTKL